MTPSIHIDLFINADTATSVAIDTDGYHYDAKFRIETDHGHKLVVFGDRDNLRRIVAELYDQFHAAEAVQDAEELNRMDAERDRVDVEDATDDVTELGFHTPVYRPSTDPTYGRGV